MGGWVDLLAAVLLEVVVEVVSEMRQAPLPLPSQPHIPSPAGPGRLLVLSGGDDQAVTATLLQLGARCSGSGNGDCEGGGGGGAPGALQPRCCSCAELARVCIPCAHSSALRSVWAEPLRPTAAGGGPAATCFSLGLDQLVRCWRLELRSVPGPGPGECLELDLVELGCAFTQVSEPEALDVLELGGGGGADSGGGGGGGRSFALAVAGRGTELLTWNVPA